MNTAIICSRISHKRILISFFFNDTATTEIYTLSLHDALPIFLGLVLLGVSALYQKLRGSPGAAAEQERSEEHTSELQSRSDLVCRLLLEKKKGNDNEHEVYDYIAVEKRDSIPRRLHSPCITPR